MLLTIIWLLPLVGAALIAFMPPRLAKFWGVTVALASLAIALEMAYFFDPSQRGFQLAETVRWIPQLRIFYRLGVDGISLWLVVLNAFLTVIAILATPLSTRHLNRFIALMLAMSAGLAGVFMATDLVLFYVFWEAMLIPAYFLLWIFGEGEQPGRAAIKFVLYTLAGSLLMLVGVIGEYVFTGQKTFDLALLATMPPSASIQFGPYGFLRIAVPLFPNPVYWWDWRWVIPVLAVAAITWGALMAIAQRDMKLLVAYSSVSHMGFIVLGIFAYNVQGQQGAVLQMVNHGLIIPALFLIVAWISDRAGTRDRSAMAGLAARMPVMAGVFFVVTLAALGLPGLNSFAGEFMTLLGAWERAPVLAVFGAIGLVLAPVYMLRLFQGVMHGPPAGPVPKSDIYAGQLVLVAPLVVLMFAIGLDPNFLTSLMSAVGMPGLAR